MYFHACVFMQYEDLRPLATVWAQKCDSMVIVQHPPDGQTKRIHCHILMETSTGENWFRDSGKSTIGEFMKRGNYWIATRVQKGEHAGKPIDRSLTLTYMIKGKYPVNFSKNFSQQELDESRLLWSDSVKSEPSGDKSEKLIKDIMKHFDLKKERGLWIEEDDIELGQPRYNLESLFEMVRNRTWRMLWGEHRRAPQPWHYKQIATTVFVRLCEDAKCFDQAARLAMEHWY